ncbi:MAG: hypothetical protein ABFC78_07560 [Methanoregula sp.]
MLFLIGFTACCLGTTDGKTASPLSHPVNNTTQSNYTGTVMSGIDASVVPYLGSVSILTNASFVAEIALRDENVNEMLRHGSTIRGIIDFMPSRPKGWNMSVGPTLWIAYRDIDVYFYVNETGQVVERHEIVVPGYLYRKERSNNNTCLLDKNGTAVLVFNTREIRFPKENICS